jgi:hypothetical protein
MTGTNSFGTRRALATIGLACLLYALYATLQNKRSSIIAEVAVATVVTKATDDLPVNIDSGEMVHGVEARASVMKVFAESGSDSAPVPEHNFSTTGMLTPASNSSPVTTQIRQVGPLNCTGEQRLLTIPYVSIHGSVLTKHATFYSENWGNVLSPYWAARAMAELGGYEYKGGKFGKGTWMEYLPTQAAAKSPRPEVFFKACDCDCRLVFFHACNYGWGEISATIRNNTRSAILKYAKERPQNEVDAVFKHFGQDDWVIYDRCTNMLDRVHGIGTLQTYDVIPTTGSFTVYRLVGRREDPFDFAAFLHDEVDKYLRKRNPEVKIVRLRQSEMWVDFARLVFAPNLIIATSFTSWGLWALLSNEGRVVTLPFQEGMDPSVYPDNVQVLTNVTQLYRLDHNRTAELLGLPFGKHFSNTTEARASVMKYFVESGSD